MYENKSSEQGNHFSQCAEQALNAPQSSCCEKSWEIFHSTMEKKIGLVKSGTKSCCLSLVKAGEWALTRFHSEVTLWTSYLRLAAAGLCCVSLLLLLSDAVILTDYFITVKSLLFQQSSAEACGRSHSLYPEFFWRKRTWGGFQTCRTFSLEEEKRSSWKNLKMYFFHDHEGFFFQKNWSN